MAVRITPEEMALIEQTVAQMRAGVMAIVFGLTCGVGLFLATAWLLIKGGTEIGPNLALLNNYLPGYTVTWPGAAVGLFYGLVIGAAAGYSLARIYNRVSVRVRRGNGDQSSA